MTQHSSYNPGFKIVEIRHLQIEGKPTICFYFTKLLFKQAVAIIPLQLNASEALFTFIPNSPL